jgi:hypothetical protein
MFQTTSEIDLLKMEFRLDLCLSDIPENDPTLWYNPLAGFQLSITQSNLRIYQLRRKITNMEHNQLS